MLEKKNKKKNLTEKAKILFLFEEILDFYTKHKRDLLWRKEDITPYEVWVSEIMLQQTQVSRVSQYYVRFLKRFPDIETLAKASWDEFLPYYEGLGYYRRGKNMLLTAQNIVKYYQGVFPREIRELEKLPGVGHYTACAIASFAYDESVLAWDTNFSRVLGRFFGGTKDCTLSAIKIETVLKQYRTKKKKENKKVSFKNFNAGIMDFGSLVCTKNPKCQECPLQRNCVYFQEGGEKERKILQKKEAFPTKESQVFLILHENHKKYFSLSQKKFEPFIFDSSLMSRQEIKQFFSKPLTYLSVRPPK